MTSDIHNTNNTNGQRKFGDMRDYMAPSLFQPHRARQAIRDAHEKKIPPLVGYFSSFSSIAVNQFMAPMGFDWVFIDWEHTACDVERMTRLVRDTAFMSGGRTIPFVRVPGHDHGAIGFALDAGASIIVPQVNTVEEAQHVVSAAKFGPKARGTRSVPPWRYVPGLTDTKINQEEDVWRNMNEQAAVVIQIESVEGIKNLDAILTEVPDIDGIFIGYGDLRITMGLKAGWGVPSDEPEWQEALDTIFAIAKKHDVPCADFRQVTGTEMREAGDKYQMSMFIMTSEGEKLGEIIGELATARADISQK